MLKRHILCLILVSCLFGLIGCQSSSVQNSDGELDTRLTVTVSILPQVYFVERIGGSHVNVNAMVQTGADPHVYEPKPEQMKNLNQSDLYLKIGVEFESAWMDKFASVNPGMRIVDVSEGIERIPISESIEISQSSEAGHEEGLDPHIWLSPELVKQLSTNIYNALVEVDPLNEDEYKKNLDAFIADIQSLQQEIKSSFNGNENKPFLVFHPAWGYFAKEFNLKQVAVEVGGNEPSPKELADVITLAQEEGIIVIFTSPQFNSKAAETIAGELNGQVLVIDPLAQDWLVNMKQVAKVFSEATR